jgi:hypothetical protein
MKRALIVLATAVMLIAGSVSHAQMRDWLTRNESKTAPRSLISSQRLNVPTEYLPIVTN